MPPRICLRLSRQANLIFKHDPLPSYHCQYATAAASRATTPAPSLSQMTNPITPTSRYSPVQPPSHRRPESRNSQLFRSYVSLLHSTPLILLFQHNNLRAIEWAAIRRELAIALRKLDQSLIADGRESSAVGSEVKLQIIQTSIFEPALRVAEFYKPPPKPSAAALRGLTISSEKEDPRLTHALSEAAYKAVLKRKADTHSHRSSLVHSSSSPSPPYHHHTLRLRCKSSRRRHRAFQLRGGGLVRGTGIQRCRME